MVDPVIGKMLFTILMMLLIMATLSLLYVNPSMPQFYVCILSLIVILILVFILVYDIRRQARAYRGV